jgi:hypothetical protein
MLQMVDGHDVTSIEPNYLRRHMGLVTQEPVLFDCSLRDNIAYGSPEPLEMADIVEAARTANIHDFITSLPQVLCIVQKYNTWLLFLLFLREVVSGEWRNLHIEELHNLYCSAVSRTAIRQGHEACMGHEKWI